MATDAAAQASPAARANTGAAGATLAVSVCLATPDRVWLVPLQLEPGATVADALAASGLTQGGGGIDPAHAAVGIFGKRVPRSRRLAAGDRVEIYRPLTYDPKESRRRKAQHRQRLRASDSRR